MKEYRAIIAGTGHALPQGVLTNSDLEKIVETTDEWITSRTGIKERHKAAPEETRSDDYRRGVLAARIQSDGDYADFLYTPGGGTRYPASQESIKERLHFIKMRGNELFKVAVRSMEEISRQVLDEVKMTPG